MKGMTLVTAAILGAIFALIMIFIFSRMFGVEIGAPKFPWGFVVRDYICTENLTNYDVVTNTPRNFIIRSGDHRYRFWLDSPFAVVLYIDDRPAMLFSIYKTAGRNYGCSALRVVPRYHRWGQK